MNGDKAQREVLQTALEAIRRERPTGSFSGAFDCVDTVIETFGETDLTARLESTIEDSWSWEVVADLFGILVWSTSDNGDALMRTAERWLQECDDLRRLQIALHLDVFPFAEPARMQTVLSKVAAAFPQLESRCSELVAERAKIGE